MAKSAGPQPTAIDPMPTEPTDTSFDPQGERRLDPWRARLRLPALEIPAEIRAFAANDPAPEILDSASFRAKVAPLLDVLGYHLADPTVLATPPVAVAPFVERRLAPSPLARLAELDAQIGVYGDPSGLRHRLRRLLLSEIELLGVVGRRRDDRPIAEAAARAFRG